MRLVFADALTNAGDELGAVANLEAVLRMTPENVAALNNLSWIFHRRGDARALPLAERAHLLQPKSPAVTDTYGWILLSSGHVAQAVQALEEAAQLAPRQPDIAFHYAAALARSGARPEATRRLRTLLADHGDFSERKAAQTLLAQLGG